MTFVNVFQYLFPCLVVSIAVVLLCFYLHAKKKRAAYDVTMATVQEDGSSSIQTISRVEGQEVAERHCDRLPPRYSTTDLPPPYSLFDPKLTGIWPGGPPPTYEMYPITLPLAPHLWRTTSRPPSPSTSPHPPTGHPTFEPLPTQRVS
ncbi:uncharacterized protein LOC144005087 [Festucalex cinctus]